MARFTVIELIRELGFEPAAPLSWEIGAAVRDLFIAQYGESPVKALRTKTAGVGSHCFAIYPAGWRPEATRLVAKILGEAAAARRAQGVLPLDGSEAGAP